jgi:hypothetical protein
MLEEKTTAEAESVQLEGNGSGRGRPWVASAEFEVLDDMMKLRSRV